VKGKLANGVGSQYFIYLKYLSCRYFDCAVLAAASLTMLILATPLNARALYRVGFTLL
jgi:hypothetical protein